MIALGPNELRGSYPPLVTPFRDGVVDHDSYQMLVDYQISAGSHGIVVTGTSGEPALLSLAERMQLAETAIATAAGRLPVVVATGAPSLADTLALSQHATEIGASALLVVTPAFSRPPQRGVVAFYREVCRATTLPVLLYHIPGRTALGVEVETIAQIAEQCENLVGVKHASSDLGWVTDLQQRLGTEFRIFVGLEDLSFPMLAVGATGLINAIANVFPRAVVDLYDAVRRGDLAAARRLHHDLWQLNKAVFFDTNPIAVKYMMRSRGLLGGNEERVPMAPASPDVERRCDEVLAALSDTILLSPPARLTGAAR